MLVKGATGHIKLTHLSLDKMAAIFRCIFVNEKFCNLIKISVKFVPKGSIPQTPDIFSLADAAWKHLKYTCFCVLPLEFRVNIDIHKHENNEVLCSNCHKSLKEMAGNSILQKHENMLIDFVWLNVLAKYLIQTIWYNFKWDMALWKWPKCPGYIQRTWWQTVATQHPGLT